MKLRFRSYRAGDANAFRTLNEAWIRTYFTLEEKDRTTLGDPEKYILVPGGHIFFAEEETQGIVGCCALERIGDAEFELSKMAVEEAHRGQGIARGLMQFVVQQARALDASRLFLVTNHTLTNAIALYRSAGFEHLPPARVPKSPYARADVFMELLL